MKIRQAVEDFDLTELEKLHFDLESGGKHLRELVKERMEELNTHGKRICAVCGEEVGSEGIELTFGPKELRKKAHLCAYDCLEYFITQLRERQL